MKDDDKFWVPFDKRKKVSERNSELSPLEEIKGQAIHHAEEIFSEQSGYYPTPRLDNIPLSEHRTRLNFHHAPNMYWSSFWTNNEIVKSQIEWDNAVIKLCATANISRDEVSNMLQQIILSASLGSMNTTEIVDVLIHASEDK